MVREAREAREAREGGEARPNAARGPRTGTDPVRRALARRRVAALARLLDSAFVVPGTRTPIGLDALLGLVPVAGDAVSALLSLAMVREARHLGASRWLQARMLGNVAIDLALGAVPIVGDAADVFFRANRRNLRLLQEALGEPFLDGADDDGRTIDVTPGRPR